MSRQVFLICRLFDKLNMGKEDLTNILNGLSDKGVYWSGDDIDELGIKKGMSYNKIMTMFIAQFLEISKSKFNVGELSIDSNNIKTRDEAIELMINKFNNLSTNDISHVDESILNGKLSMYASDFIGKKMEYSVESTQLGARIGFDIGKDLDSKNILNSRIVVYGQSETGKNIIMDTPEKVSSVTVTNDKYPVYVDVNVRMMTQGGTVDLNKNIILSNPTLSGIFSNTFDIKDRTHNAPLPGKLIDWIKSSDASQIKLEKYQDALINSEAGDISVVVPANSYKINELIKNNNRITGILNETSKNISSLEQFSDKIINDTNNIKSELKAIQNKVDNFNPSGGGINGTISESNSSLSTNII